MTLSVNRALLRRLTPEQRRDVKEAVAYAYLYGTPPMECLRSLPHKLSAFEIRWLYHQCVVADGDRAVLCRCGRAISHRGACVKNTGGSSMRWHARVRPIPDSEINTTCPCCGNGMHSQFIAVDLQTNTVGYQNRAWRVSPQLAVFVHKLVESYPRAVDSYDMRIAIWGAIDGPDHDDSAIKIHASIFRRFMQSEGIGVDLLRGPRPGSYVLKKREATNDGVSAGDAAVGPSHSNGAGH